MKINWAEIAVSDYFQIEQEKLLTKVIGCVNAEIAITAEEALQALAQDKLKYPEDTAFTNLQIGRAQNVLETAEAAAHAHTIIKTG